MAQVRLADRSPGRVLELVGCVLDLDRGVIRPRSGGPALALTTRERTLLQHLADAAPAAVSRDELLARVWGYSDGVLSRACDNAVRRTREKIEVDPSAPDHLLTVHGTGYQLVLSSTRADVTPFVASPVAPDLILGDLSVDLGRMLVRGPFGEISLTAIEVRLLARLMRAQGASVDRGMLMREVWEQSVGGRRVDSAVGRLRSKIELDPSSPRHLLTTSGGYRLVVLHTASGRPLGTLAAPRDRFVGRMAEIARVREALAGGTRVVAILGPGGIGKTRLALEVVRGLASGLAGGGWWVELREVRTAPEVAAAVAEALGVPGSGGGTGSVERIALALGSRGPTIVLLDDLDHAGDAAAELIGQWLDRAPGVSFVLTSRVRPPLASAEGIVLGPLETADGVALLGARGAGSVDRPTLEALVHELDGIPLALELAAARVRVLSTGRVGDPLRVLNGGGIDRPSRHRSLAASLEASAALLPRRHLATLGQLSVFAGGFDAAAAEVVVPSQDDDVLQLLCDHSWLRCDPDTGRFEWLEVLRDFAARQLSDADRAAAEARHGAYFAELGSRSSLERSRLREGGPVRDALTRERANLLAAGQRALARGDAATATGCALAVAREALRSGRAEASVALVEAAARLPERAAELQIALAWVLPPGRLAEAHAAAERAVKLTESCGPRERGWALGLEGTLLAQLGRRGEAFHRFEAALATARATGDRVGEGYALVNLANVIEDPGRCIPLLLEALEVHPAPDLVPSVYNNLAVQYTNQLRVHESRDAARRARRVAIGVGLLRIVGSALVNLAILELRHGTSASCEAAIELAASGCRDLGLAEASLYVEILRLACATNEGRFDDADRALTAALELADGRMDTVAAAGALNVSNLHRLRGRWDEAVWWAERGRTWVPLLADAAIAGIAVNRAPSRETVAGLRAAAVAVRGLHPSYQWTAELASAEALLLLGDPDAAAAIVDELDAERIACVPRQRAMLEWIRAGVRSGRGDREGAREGANRADRFAAGLDDDPESEVGRLRARILAALG